MKNILRLLIPLTLILCVLAMGCTQPAPAPAPVPVPATPLPVATTLQVPVSPTAQTCSLTPGPTQQVPEDESVSITVNRNTISENPTITTRFNGGLGLGMIQRMAVTVIRSDCVTEQGLQDAPGIGASVTLMGTTKTDRVIVVVTMTSGDQYTVIDNDYPFPKAM
ncbi:MAG: hypothetical protein CVV30_08540 [Methanomicrobiales archaeon HGW-Methanomicrobiales-1]|jgi:hypothetical protein|nr:MAG: hypothetical protein CVV30_08540 [Methanomicrobiales archaeon HGW-Methanomicrobiales-1]